MALPSSGVLSINDIAGEFGGSVPHSLSEYYGVAAGVPSSGTISISDFYGASALAPIAATGGTISDSGGYRYHTFTSSGTFTINAVGVGGDFVNMSVMVWGGGASGGRGAGGGAGGKQILTLSSATLGTGNFSMTVGAGGAGTYTQGGTWYAVDARGKAGGDSSAFGYTAGGGGGGGGGVWSSYTQWRNGVSGRYNNGAGGGGHPYYGNASGGSGRNGAGNGGAGYDAWPYGSAGGGGNLQSGGDGNGNPGNGGYGYVWLDGVRRGGGGGGGAHTSTVGQGGSGGGGIGRNKYLDQNGGDGANGYGAGGGGSEGQDNKIGIRSGNGGSGIIRIRYKI